MTTETDRRHERTLAARAIVAHMTDGQMAAIESGELFPCLQYGHDDCAASSGGACMGEQGAALAVLEREGWPVEHVRCRETCNCCTTWNVRLGYPCSCPRPEHSPDCSSATCGDGGAAGCWGE